MPAVLRLIGQQGEQGFDDCRKLLAMLAGLWKFRLLVEGAPPALPLPERGDGAPLVICYCRPNEDFEEGCRRLVQASSPCRVLLMDRVAKSYGSALRSLFGVSAVRARKAAGALKLSRIGHDPLTAGLDEVLSLRVPDEGSAATVVSSGAAPLLAGADGSCFLTRFNACYCSSLPVWQLGVPTFPQLYLILRNFLFFADGLGHFSPFPYVSLRIDDFPLASEQYLRAGGVVDATRALETAQLCEWSREFSARLEFMVNSHVMDGSGAVRPLEGVVPQSCATLRRYLREGVVNLNAHGSLHLDGELYRQRREISPMEFSALGAQQTRENLRQCLDFIDRYFGKKAAGFVPPCWSYRQGQTKAICSDFFSFIIDSSANYRLRADCRPLGEVDGAGLLHLLETWHLGSSSFDYREPSLWSGFLHCGIPVHMMAHGPYLADPLPRRPELRALLLLFALLCAPALMLLDASGTFRKARALFSPVKWDRLALARGLLSRLPHFRNRSLRTLLDAGKRHQVSWCFTETLAENLREFAGLEVLDCRKGAAGLAVSFRLATDCAAPFLFHPPFTPASAALDGVTLAAGRIGRTIELQQVAAGEHHLTIARA